ncbi:Transcription factor gsfR2 [Trichoderma ghanense]|uniref:Transcription factor gsfR2 n=1 Tax=Trichoderma ghanense TaxID=65468 RepID=A0ABY2H1C5_9HYPO
MISTRKKSCSACVAGKRRCDLDLPSCGRCRKSRKDCVYPWMMAVGGSEQGLGMASPPMSVGADLTQDMSGVWQAGVNTSSGSSSGSSHGGPSAVSAYLSPGPLSTTLPPPLVPCLLSQLDEYVLQDQDQAFLSLGPGPGPMDSPLLGRLPAAEYAASPEFIYFDLANTPVTTGSVFQARAEWAAGRFAMQPQILAMTGQNCFVHHTQVASSEVLQEALAASALHCMRNTANASLIRGEIAKRVARLIGSIRHAVTCASEGAAGTAPDLLPALQALVVYQCIRLFSRDDIGERMRAERDEVIVQSLLLALYPRLRSFSKAMDSWSSWIYYESMRRTVLTAEILSGTYNFLKQGWDQAEARTLQLKFTAQVALWEAKTAVEWEAMWARGPRLQVTVRTFREDARSALPEDMDDLGMVLWALHRGLEEMESWMGRRKAVLVRWGLRPEGETWEG